MYGVYTSFYYAVCYSAAYLEHFCGTVSVTELWRLVTCHTYVDMPSVGNALLRVIA